MSPRKPNGTAALEDQYRRLLAREQAAERQIEHASGLKAIDEAYERIEAEKRRIREEMNLISKQIRAKAGSSWKPHLMKPLVEPAHYHTGYEAVKVLRAAGREMTTREVAEGVAVRVGFDFADPQVSKRLIANVRGFFTACARDGLIRSEGSPAQWSIPPRAAPPDTRDSANILPSPVSYASWLHARRGS